MPVLELVTPRRVVFPVAVEGDPRVEGATRHDRSETLAARRPVKIEGPLRLLVVEDSFMSARLLVRMIEDLGIRVVGPAASVRQAMMLLDQEPCDGAILDINLGNETVEPVAKRLEDMRIPFFFVTGYSSPALADPRLKAHRLLSKPVDPLAFRNAIHEAFGPDRR